MKKVIVLFFLLAFFGLPSFAHADSWPADTVGTDIGTLLMADYPAFEPSGVTWSNYANGYVVVSDEGVVAVISSSGEVEHVWDLGSSYDLEDVATVDSDSQLIYLLDENTTTIRQFDLSTGTLTGLSWSGSAYITEVDGTYGAEGLAWVPDGYSDYAHGTSGGLFYVGWQYDGDIYVFDVNLEESGAATYVDEIHMTTGYTDISGLDWNSETQTLYALYDGLNILEERSADGVLRASYSLPSGEDQEGIAVVPTSFSAAHIVISEDGGGRVMEYSGYPAVTIDEDGDGIAATEDSNDNDFDNDGVEGATWGGADCNDADSSVSTERTYYRDADGDGLGEAEGAAAFCSTTAPAGYVDNTDDTNDEVVNNGIEIADDGIDNNSDGQIDERNLVNAVGAHPYYSTLDPATSSAAISIARGVRYGRMIVRYADDSEYRYTVFNTTRRYKLHVRMVARTAYAIVQGKKKVAIVNMLTGEVVVRHKRFHNGAKLAVWTNQHIGFTP